MAMQFEYDEEGGTFFYFLLSFWGLVIIPATYYLWPRKKSKDETENEEERIRRQCHCGPCGRKKNRLSANDTWLKTKDKAIKFGLIIGWVIFALLAYKVSKIQLDYVEYDPYTELNIDRGASQSEIKRAYRKLSLKFHPDKESGDSKKFMRIAKAYAALTDEESRKNWEEYGNPDGPGVTRFGIALPKWIIEDENSMWVLLVYGLIFMVILPIAVGIWWYRSIKFSKDQVLLDTTRLYYYFFQKVPNMILKKSIMILAASFEFDKFHNSEIVERPSDNEEVPQLMKQLPNLDEKNKEKPLCYGYSVKARALLHSHFQRLELPQNSLEIDRRYVLSKCPVLINEMINITSQLVASAMARRSLQYMPRLETVEHCMRMSQMIIQGLDNKSSPLQQLPHIGPEMLRHFVTKKRNVQRIRDLVAMKEEDRRALLRSLSDEEYRDVINVCSTLPHVTLEIESKVLDDEDSSITAGSIVTVTVILKRENMEVMFEKEKSANEYQPLEIASNEAEDKQDVDGGEEEENKNATKEVEEKKEHKVWEKQKKKGKKGGKPKKKQPKQAYNWKKKPETVTSKTEEEANQNALALKENGEESGSEGEEPENESDAEEEKESPKPPKKSSTRDRKKSEGEEDDWEKFQEESKKENSLERKLKISHTVHCPYFPDDKQEGWWLYVGDRKSRMLVSAPVQILSLRTSEEIELKFSAPSKPGLYTYSVILRSDCYFDFDQVHNIKLDVKEAKVIEDHPQWDISDDEDDADKEKADEASDDSDYDTDMDDSDY